ncbi:MAG: lipid II flippase MurJ, partial [Myxococcota bacterium]
NNFVTIPAAMGLGAISLPIVALLYRHGAFTWVDAEETARATAAFCPWLFATSAVRSSTQVFYALEDLKTPVRVSAATVVLTLLLGWLLLPYGVTGLCAALSAASVLQLVVMTALLRRRCGALGLRELSSSALVQGALALVAALLARGVTTYGVWEDGGTLWNAFVLAAALVVAVGAYAGGAITLGLDEVAPVMQKLRSKLGHRRR